MSEKDDRYHSSDYKRRNLELVAPIHLVVAVLMIHNSITEVCRRNSSAVGNVAFKIVAWSGFYS